MALVKVYNDSHIDFVGKFKDKAINIAAGKYIEMGRAEAHTFLSEYSSVKIDGAGRHQMPKKLRLDEDLEVKATRYNQPLKYKAYDGTMFRTTQGLQKHESLLQTQTKDVDDAKPKKRRTAPTPTI